MFPSKESASSLWCLQQCNYMYVIFLVVGVVIFIVGQHPAWQGNAGSNLFSVVRTHRIRAAIICHHIACSQDLADSDGTQLRRLSSENVRKLALTVLKGSLTVYFIKQQHRTFHCWYGNPMANSFLKNWILNGLWITNLIFTYIRSRHFTCCLPAHMTFKTSGSKTRATFRGSTYRLPCYR